MKILRVVVGLGLMTLVGLQVWTQYKAYHYGYHAALGIPVTTVKAFYRQTSLYPPWMALVWEWRWGAWLTMMTCTAAVMLVILLAILAPWLRRRGQPPALEGHGRGHWGKGRRALKKAGLL